MARTGLALLLSTLVIFFIFAAVRPVSAETETDSLRQRIKKIEAQLSKGDHAIFPSVNFHGYGEIHFNFPKTGVMDSDADNIADFHRFVLGWEVEFSETIRMASEIDFEHNASEIELEYAQIEFDFAPTHSVRVGALLMPVGSLNEFHEPPNFYSIERPYTQSNVIPTTWQENGVGLSGRFLDAGVAYRLYLTAGLEGAGFTTSSGLRKGRSKGIKSVLNDAAIVGRLEYSPALGYRSGKLQFGGSFYFGGADQNDSGLGDITISLFEVDASYQVGGFHAHAEGVVITIDRAGALSAVAGETIGERIVGAYAEVGYDLLKAFAPNSTRRLVAFARHEQIDTNDKAPLGFAQDPKAHRKIWTTGLAYFPIDKVAIKADMENWKDGSGDTVTRINSGIGFMF